MGRISIYSGKGPRRRMPEISVDRDRCLGSGVCIVFAPHTFAHDEAARAVVVDPEGDPLDAVRSAVEGCPTSALRLENDQEGA